MIQTLIWKCRDILLQLYFETYFSQQTVAWFFDNPEIETLNLETGHQRSKPWDSLSNTESWQPYLWLVSFLLLALTSMGFMSFHLFQCCSNFIDPDAICWSFFNSGRYCMIPFILFIHQLFHVLLSWIFSPFLVYDHFARYSFQTVWPHYTLSFLSHWRVEWLCWVTSVCAVVPLPKVRLKRRRQQSKSKQSTDTSRVSSHQTSAAVMVP